MEISGQSLGRTPLYKRLIIDQMRRISTSFDMHDLYRLYSRRNLYPPWSLPCGGSEGRFCVEIAASSPPLRCVSVSSVSLDTQWRVNTCVRFGSHNHLEAHRSDVTFESVEIYRCIFGKPANSSNIAANIPNSLPCSVAISWCFKMF